MMLVLARWQYATVPSFLSCSPCSHRLLRAAQPISGPHIAVYNGPCQYHTAPSSIARVSTTQHQIA
eukprot:2865293-Rhodomonas_salina.1